MVSAFLVTEYSHTNSKSFCGSTEKQHVCEEVQHSWDPEQRSCCFCKYCELIVPVLWQELLPGKIFSSLLTDCFCTLCCLAHSTPLAVCWCFSFRSSCGSKQQTGFGSFTSFFICGGFRVQSFNPCSLIFVLWDLLEKEHETTTDILVASSKSSLSLSLEICFCWHTYCSPHICLFQLSLIYSLCRCVQKQDFVPPKV